MKLFIMHDPRNPDGLEYARYTIWHFFAQMPQRWDPDSPHAFDRQVYFCIQPLGEDIVASARDQFTKLITTTDYPNLGECHRREGRLACLIPARRRRINLPGATGIEIPPSVIKFINDEALFQDTIDESISQEPDNHVLVIDSNMLVPLHILRREKLPLLKERKDLVVPIATYKYYYKTLNYNGKTYRVKEFVPSSEQFYDFCGCGDVHAADINELNMRSGGGPAFIPSQHERYVMTHELWTKLVEAGQGGRGNLPFLSPSPLIHGWGSRLRLVLRNPSEQHDDATLANHCLVVHKFENWDIS